MNNFIIATFFLERKIDENLFFSNGLYKGNQINLDNTNNIIKGIPDLIIYKKPNEKKIYGTGVNKRDRLEDKYILLIKYKIGKNKNIKKEIKQIICYKEINEYIKEEEINLEIEITGKNRLLKFLYELRNVIYFEGDIYCKKSLNTASIDYLIIKDFQIENCFINLINPSIGINYLNIIIPYQRLIKEKLINYIYYKNSVEIDLRREICDIVMTDSKISINELGKEEDLTLEKILLPNGFKEILEILTYDYRSVKERLIEELGEDEFNLLNQYIDIVEEKSKQVHRVLVPFNPNLTEICTKDNLNLEASIKRVNKGVEEKEICLNVNTVNIDKESIYISNKERIKDLMSKNKIEVIRTEQYFIKRDFKEFKVYIYVLKDFIEEIKDLLEDTILILEYDINKIPDNYNFILTDEEKLIILEKFLLNN